MSANFLIQEAIAEQATDICELVNLAYRGNRGWTNENKLVTGLRTTLDETRTYLADERAHLLVAMVKSEIIASICMELKHEYVQIGYFAVHPNCQGQGVGKRVLQYAEEYAFTRLNKNRFVMAVVSSRPELVAFYERRGYRKTGLMDSFPEHRNVGTPLKKDLTIEYLEKVSGMANKGLSPTL